MGAADAATGYVVIGRNEGARLERCLASLPRGAARIYVDSASTDDSVAIARAFGVDIVELKADRPLTAARARNAGLERLRESAPGARYVAFVDGDSELAPGWPDAAASFLDARADVAVVSGAVTERHPERSVYNRLCDIEWQAPVGERLACGGIATMRAAAVREAGGFCADLKGGEEPELCVRLRARGHKVWRLDAPMALHDADILSFAQWFQRMRRGGRAFAEISSLHRRSPARIWRRETYRALGWAAVLPAALLGAVAVDPAALALLAAYPAQILRLAVFDRTNLPPGARDFAWPYACYMTAAKFAEALGVLDFALSARRRLARPAAPRTLII